MSCCCCHCCVCLQERATRLCVCVCFAKGNRSRFMSNDCGVCLRRCQPAEGTWPLLCTATCISLSEKQFTYMDSVQLSQASCESAGHVIVYTSVIFKSFLKEEMENSKALRSCTQGCQTFLFAHAGLKEVTVYVYIILQAFMSGTEKKNMSVEVSQ